MYRPDEKCKLCDKEFRNMAERDFQWDQFGIIFRDFLIPSEGSSDESIYGSSGEGSSDEAGRHWNDTNTVVPSKFVPCLHQIFCLSCAQKYTKCPFCETPIEKVLQTQEFF